MGFTLTGNQASASLYSMLKVFVTSCMMCTNIQDVKKKNNNTRARKALNSKSFRNRRQSTCCETVDKNEETINSYKQNIIDDEIIAMVVVNETICPKSHANVLWYLTWLCLGTGMYGYKRGHMNLFFVPFSVFVTSLNYWRNPVMGLNRTIDVVVVRVGCAYQMYHSLFSTCFWTYAGVLSVALLCYPVSWYLHLNNRPRLGLFFHSMVHCLGNLANVILYSGQFVT